MDDIQIYFQAILTGSFMIESFIIKSSVIFFGRLICFGCDLISTVFGIRIYMIPEKLWN